VLTVERDQVQDEEGRLILDGWSLIPCESDFNDVFSSQNIQCVPRYLPADIASLILQFPAQLIQDGDSWWDWKAQIVLESGTLVMDMTLLEDLELPSWGGSRLTGAVAAEDLADFWCHLLTTCKDICLHNEEGDVYSEPLFRIAYFQSSRPS